MKKLLHLFSPLLGIGLLSLALWVLSRELGNYKFDDVMTHVRNIPRKNIIESLILCFLSYAVLTAYDYLGLRYARVGLSYAKTTLCSFISYSLSHNLGFALLTGGAARLRLLTHWNVSAKDVAKQVAFVNFMFALGYCAIAGITFVFYPTAATSFSHYGVFVTGLVLLALVIAFFVASFFGREPILILGRQIPRVSFKLSLVATAIAAFDWGLAAAVAWRVFPDGTIPFGAFLGVFLIAQIIGLISHVPGGIGVFEGVMVSALSGTLAADKVLGCLLIYRLIYYTIPFVLALFILSGFEAWRQRARISRAIKALSRN